MMKKPLKPLAIAAVSIIATLASVQAHATSYMRLQNGKVIEKHECSTDQPCVDCTFLDYQTCFNQTVKAGLVDKNKGLESECNHASATYPTSTYLPYMKGQIVCRVPGSSPVAKQDEPKPKGPTIVPSNEESAVPYSIFEVVKDTPACWRAFSADCVMLKRGERVVFGGGDQITVYSDGRRQGLCCLRSPSMRHCGFANLAAIEVNGKRGPVLGMSSKEEEERVYGRPLDVPPESPFPVPTLKITAAPAKPGELPACGDEITIKTLKDVLKPDMMLEIKDMYRSDATKKRWCYVYFNSPYYPGGYRMGAPYQEAIFTLEWINQSENRFWLQVQQQHVYRKS